MRAGHIPGSIMIPLNSLGDRLGELPRDKQIIVYCRVGHRAYVAAKILKQHGFQKGEKVSPADT